VRVPVTVAVPLQLYPGPVHVHVAVPLTVLPSAPAVPEKLIAIVPPLSGLEAFQETLLPEIVPRQVLPAIVETVMSFPVCVSVAVYDLTWGYDVPEQLPVALSCMDQVPDRSTAGGSSPFPPHALATASPIAQAAMPPDEMRMILPPRERSPAVSQDGGSRAMLFLLCGKTHGDSRASRRARVWAQYLSRHEVRDALRSSRNFSVPEAVTRVNPIISGWVNYFRVGNSSKTFVRLGRGPTCNPEGGMAR
jgi:hypothetical protein